VSTTFENVRGTSRESLIDWISAEEKRIFLIKDISNNKILFRDILRKRILMFAIIALVISIVGMFSENRFSVHYLTKQQISQELSQGIE
jgi:hypothetical protein